MSGKFFLFAVSIGVAYLLIRTEAVLTIISFAKEWEYLGVFFAGMMFTSAFTIAPATVVLGEIAAQNHLLSVAVVGGLGAAVADCLILFLFENRIRLHLASTKDRGHYKRLMVFFSTPGMHIFGLVVGAILIALPLPDEIGLALMGLTHVKVSHLLPVAFVLNTIGVYLVGLAAIALL